MASFAFPLNPSSYATVSCEESFVSTIAAVPGPLIAPVIPFAMILAESKACHSSPLIGTSPFTTREAELATVTVIPESKPDIPLAPEPLLA
jgi:hypothetical protein